MVGRLQWAIETVLGIIPLVLKTSKPWNNDFRTSGTMIWTHECLNWLSNFWYKYEIDLQSFFDLFTNPSSPGGQEKMWQDGISKERRRWWIALPPAISDTKICIPKCLIIANVVLMIRAPSEYPLKNDAALVCLKFIELKIQNVLYKLLWIINTMQINHKSTDRVNIMNPKYFITIK